MIIRQVMINRQTKANSGDSSMENALLAAYQKINTWSTTGIKMTIRESEDPAKGDLILLLDKSGNTGIVRLAGDRESLYSGKDA